MLLLQLCEGTIRIFMWPACTFLNFDNHGHTLSPALSSQPLPRNISFCSFQPMFQAVSSSSHPGIPLWLLWSTLLPDLRTSLKNQPVN